MKRSVQKSLWGNGSQNQQPSPATQQSSYQRYRLEETCHHEASHTVAAHQLKIPFSSVSVMPGADSLGHLTLSKRATTFNPKDMDAAEVDEWIRKHGIVCLAG